MLEFIIFLMFFAFVCIALVVYLINQARTRHKMEMLSKMGLRTPMAFTRDMATPTLVPKDEPSTEDLIEQLERVAAIKKPQQLKRTDRNVEQERGYTARQPGPCTLQIDYIDADGVCTARSVAPYRSGNTNEKFDAWCAMRQDRRTFFFERIRSATHLNTGARLDRAGVFQHIHPDRRVPKNLR